ncbi:MAG: acyltransferase family protein [Alphaproteobacteria bacterium]|nr:acyltransferase family protein [Alphaproteobacteria bacterium]
MAETRRIDEIDMAKGLGILLVVLIHLYEYTGVAYNRPILYPVIRPFAEGIILMFLLLSGYTYHAGKSIKADFIKKIKTLLVPYCYLVLFSSIVYFLFVHPSEYSEIKKNFEYSVSSLFAMGIVNLFDGSTEFNPMYYVVFPSWYIIELFSSFCLIIALYKPLQKKSIPVRWGVVAGFLLISMIFNALDLQKTIANSYFQKASYFFILPNIFGFASVLFTGSLFHETYSFDTAYSKRTSVILLILSIAFVTFLKIKGGYYYALQYGRWGEFGFWSVPITFIGGIAETYTLLFLFHFVKKLKFFKLILVYLGKHSLDILLSHTLFIVIFCKLFGKWHTVYIEKLSAEQYSYPIALAIFALTGVATISFLFGLDFIRSSRHLNYQK